jgi:hypothetical protein
MQDNTVMVAGEDSAPTTQESDGGYTQTKADKFLRAAELACRSKIYAALDELDEAKLVAGLAVYESQGGQHDAQ